MAHKKNDESFLTYREDPMQLNQHGSILPKPHDAEEPGKLEIIVDIYIGTFLIYYE